MSCDHVNIQLTEQRLQKADKKMSKTVKGSLRELGGLVFGNDKVMMSLLDQYLTTFSAATATRMELACYMCEYCGVDYRECTDEDFHKAYNAFYRAVVKIDEAADKAINEVMAIYGDGKSEVFL